MILQRLNRVPWVLGMVLIGSSLAGGSYMFNARKAEGSPQDEAAVVRSNLGQGVVTIGVVDVESSMLPLAPMQPGSVSEILCYEQQSVNKGDLLLKVDEEPFLKKMAEAQAGVFIAETQLTQARQGMERFTEILAQQEAAVRATRSMYEAGEIELKKAERLDRTLNNKEMTKEDLAAGRKRLESVRAKLDAEEFKLREVQRTKPDAKIDEAQRNVELRKSQVDQVREALDRCTLRAPQDGTIERLQATVGSQFGPQSHHAAIIFAPNAPRVLRVEVEQEFAGRINLGASATIQDETNIGPVWRGKVLRIANAFLPARKPLGPEFITTGSENRVLEVIVSIEPAQTMPKLGQRMRASIGPTGR